MTRLEEIAAKATRIRGLMDERNLSAVALNTQANFAWITGGADNYVGLSSDGGVATVVVTDSDIHVIASAIEAPRMADEEIADLGFTLHEHPWIDDAAPALVADIAGGPIGADHGLSGAENIAPDIARLRWQLLPPEVDRYRSVGRESARIVQDVAREIAPGMTELQISGLMEGKVFAAGLLPNVCLIAADERAYKYRHPIPTERELEKHVMLVIGARRWGLGISATRMVHFGPIPDELARKHLSVCTVDACFILGSKPGARVSDIFNSACDEYARQGFEGEWKLHHQGGATGYAARDYKGDPTSTEVVLDQQAFAWNPSIAGTKSEDTVLATPGGPEVLSPSGDWPKVTVEYGGETIDRPGILQR